MGWFWNSNKQEKPSEVIQAEPTDIKTQPLSKIEETKKTGTDPTGQPANPENPPTADLIKIDPKEKLIRVAATFLTNPKIEKESYELKRTFQKRKGLDDDMIKKAFELYKEKIRMQQEEKELKEAIADNGNDISEEGITRRIKKAKQTKFLSLRNCQLTKIPEAVFTELEELEVFIVSGNLLEGIPADIGKQTKQKTFQGVGCGQSQAEIASEFFGLENQEELNQSKNGVSGLDQIVKFKNLRRLDQSYNELMALPEDVWFFLFDKKRLIFWRN